MNKKQFIINSIKERDRQVYQTLLKLWRLGYTKKQPIRPKTLILFPPKGLIKGSQLPYTHSLPRTILGVFRHKDPYMEVIYLSSEYTNTALIQA